MTIEIHISRSVYKDEMRGVFSFKNTNNIFGLLDNNYIDIGIKLISKL